MFLQHPGSDESVWKNARPLARMAALQKAASAENFLLRVEDVPAVLDQLESWNKSKDHELAGRLDVEHVGMSGHSFGALVVPNQEPPAAPEKVAELRAKAEKQEQAKRYNEYVKTLIELADAVPDAAERVDYLIKAADLYTQKFSNAAEAVKCY